MRVYYESKVVIHSTDIVLALAKRDRQLVNKANKLHERKKESGAAAAAISSLSRPTLSFSLLSPTQ